MIRRLQKKFVFIAMVSLMLILIVIAGFISGVMIYQVNKSADFVLAFLADNGGVLPEPDLSRLPKPRQDQVGRLVPVNRLEERFFIVRLDSADLIIEVDTRNTVAISDEQAGQYAQSALSQEKNTGFVDASKYLVLEQEDESFLIFVDCRFQLLIIFSFLKAFMAISLLILVMMFLLVSVFSKRAVRPVAESIEKQKRFITDAGHEIKTPLAIISANADVLEIQHGQSEWTDSLRNQTKRLDGLVKQLLTLAKMEEESAHHVHREFSLSNVVGEMASSFEALAAAEQKRFLLDVQPDLTLHGDEDGIRRMISILVDNAVKYAETDGEIRVLLFLQGRTKRLEVWNSGDNLPEGDLQRLFDRFYRGDESRSGEGNSYGIGLAIAKAVVEAHKGKITAKRPDEKHICFVVRF